MFNMGGGELALVALVTLLLVKPEKLPQVATNLGRWLTELRRNFNDVKRSVEEGLKDQPTKIPSKKITLQSTNDPPSS